MKQFLKHRINRHGYDGWAVQVKEAPRVLEWTVSTTRKEAREVRAKLEPDLFARTEVVKVKIQVTPIAQEDAA